MLTVVQVGGWRQHVERVCRLEVTSASGMVLEMLGHMKEEQKEIYLQYLEG